MLLSIHIALEVQLYDQKAVAVFGGYSMTLSLVSKLYISSDCRMIDERWIGKDLE